MSDLIAFAYDDVDTSREVMEALDRLGMEHVVEFEDAVIVERREDGRHQIRAGRWSRCEPRAACSGAA